MSFYRYGQSLTWSAQSAPAIFTGEQKSYRFRDAVTKQLIEGAGSDYVAMALHSRKGQIDFETMITSGSTDFFDLSSGAAITRPTELGTGVVLIQRLRETWALLKEKTASGSLVWYPEIVQTTPQLAGTLSAFTPATQTGNTVYPGTVVKYSTTGMTHASGVLQELIIEQMLELEDDPPSPIGKILGVAACSYQREITMKLLATGAMPAVDTVLALTGAPAHAANYRITDSAKALQTKQGMIYDISASWIPAFG